MAVATKGHTALASSQSIAASGTFTSAWLDVHSAIEAGIAASLTWTGSTTAAPTITVNISPDNGTTVFQFTQLTGPVGASPWNPPIIALPDWVAYAQIVAKDNDASVALTLNADGEYISQIA